MHRRRLVAVLILLWLAGLGAWSFWWEPSSLRVSEYTLPLQHWPAQNAGLRIAIITDIHAGAPYIDRDQLARIVSLTNAAHPDLIVLLGDYVIHDVLGGHFIPPEETAKILGGLHAPLGVYGVLGNHDFALDWVRIGAAFNAAGIHFIDDALAPIRAGRYRFTLMGVTSSGPGLPVAKRLLQDVNDDEPVIAITHIPDYFPMLPARINLVLAGHSHGGQVRLPLIGAPVTGSMYGQRYLRGHVLEHTDLFVSTGIGTSILPVRFGVPPEISIVTLLPATTP
jgi:predicted MPP superfamily phosphohydrolase